MKYTGALDLRRPSQKRQKKPTTAVAVAVVANKEKSVVPTNSTFALNKAAQKTEELQELQELKELKELKEMDELKETKQTKQTEEIKQTEETKELTKSKSDNSGLIDRSTYVPPSINPLIKKRRPSSRDATRRLMEQSSSSSSSSSSSIDASKKEQNKKTTTSNTKKTISKKKKTKKGENAKEAQMNSSDSTSSSTSNNDDTDNTKNITTTNDSSGNADNTGQINSGSSSIRSDVNELSSSSPTMTTTDEWSDIDPVNNSGSRILVNPSSTSHDTIQKKREKHQKSRSMFDRHNSNNHTTNTTANGKDGSSYKDEGRLEGGTSSVLDAPINHHPWMNPGFGLHSEEAEHVNNEMKRLEEMTKRAQEEREKKKNEVSHGGSGSDDDDDGDDDTLFAKVLNEDRTLKEGTKLWIQREKDINRRERRIQKRLINIASKKHQTKVNQVYEAKRRTQLMEDIELGKRIDELFQAKEDAQVAERGRLTLESDMNLAALIRGPNMHSKKK